MLSGEEIKSRMGRSITIDPFDPMDLRGAAYNLRVGPFVWMHPAPQRGAPALPLVPAQTVTGRYYVIPHGACISIMTRETLHVGLEVAGLFHAKVDMATKGFSQVSTTLDPGWIGPLLITMQNISGADLTLWEGETFVKVGFYRLRHATRIPHNNRPGRLDLLHSLGFQIPPEEAGHLDEVWRNNPAVLRRRFRESAAGRALLAETRSGRRRIEGILRRVGGPALVLIAASFPAWTSAVFQLTWGTTELAIFMTTALLIAYSVIGRRPNEDEER